MDFSWILPENFLDRIDPVPYKSKYVELMKRLKMHETQKLYKICELVKCGPFGSTVLADSYSNEGVLYLRPVNISDNNFSDKDITFLSDKDVKEKKLDLFGSNDLFFARVGNPSVSKVNSEYDKITISPNIVAVKVGNKIDSDYLWMFLSSKYGISQVERMLKTVAQPTTSTETIREINVIMPTKDIQKYIGDKVRKASELRYKSKILKNENECILKGSLDLDSLSKSINENKYNWINSRSLNDRIDGDYYKGKYSNLDLYFSRNKFKTLKQISKKIQKGVEIGSQNYSNNRNAFKFIRVSDVSYGKINTENAISIENTLKIEEKFLINKDDLIISKDGTLGLCAIGDLENKGNVISGGLVKVSFGNSDYAYYLLSLFITDLIKSQLFRNGYGSIIKHVRIDDLNEIRIPMIDGQTICKLSNNVKEYLEHDRNAEKLIAEAKKDIEDLIEINFDMSKIREIN